MPEDDMIRIESLAKTYPGKRPQEPVKAVDNITFTVKRGELLGLLGPNGAGKTTTVKMMCGLIRPNSGRVMIDGIDIHTDRNRALAKTSAVLEGNRNIYWRLTVRENLEFFAALKGKNPEKLKDQMDYYIDFFDLRSKEKDEARKLSRGMQQKLAIATAMVAGSEIVLLDEPTLGLDVKASYEIRELLKTIVEKDNRTVILTTHDMNVVQDTCERVIIINKGRIIAQDMVSNLMDLFQVKVYQIKIKGILSTGQQGQLRDVPGLDILENEHGTTISLTLDDSQLLYQVIAILGQENSVIESIDRQENNFEKVFMEIIQGSENNDHVQQASATR